MPVLYLITSLIVLSQSAVWIRMSAADATAIGFWRMIIALPILAVMVVKHEQWGRVLSLRRRQFWGLAFCGFLLYAHFYTWFLSVQKTTMANSMIVFASNPLYTAIGAWVFFGERVQPRHWVSLAFCFTGIYFMMRDSIHLSPEHLAGDVLGFVCALLFSAYVLMSKGLRRDLPNLPFALVTYSWVAALFGVSMLVLGVPFFGYSLQTWIGFSGLAFGSTLLGHSMFTYCLQFFNVNLMSISTLVEPMLTAVSGYLLFGEKLSSGAIIGFGFVVVGILVLYLPYLRSLLKR